MSDFQVRKTINIMKMKTFFNVGVAITTCLLFFSSCKKEDKSRNPEEGLLKNSLAFQKYVAGDILSRIQFSMYSAGKLSAANRSQFSTAITTSPEASIPGIFNKFGLDYHFFEKQTVLRIARRVQALNANPSLATLPEPEINRLFNEGYQQVAENLMLKVKQKLIRIEKFDGIQTPKVKQIAKNQVKLPSINTGMSFENFDYLEINSDDLLTETIVIDQIIDYISLAAGDGTLTASEVWGCFKEAMGYGAGFMGGIAGWARLTAGHMIQEIVTVVGRWAMKNIGWVGAIIATIDFADCLYEAY